MTAQPVRQSLPLIRASLPNRPFPEGTVEAVAPARPRAPRIGVALGGGAARGWAHIGVLAALEEAGIHPEIVAGCSIGAVVGGCYAAGQIGTLRRFALSLTRRRVMALLDVRLPGPGLIAGDRLRRHLVRELEGRRIEDLRVTFASVATELGTGHEVWLTNGPLVEAVRASYAIPGVFPPVSLDGRLLMDGTLVNPVPVRLARELGADAVICVNLNCDPRVRGTVIRPVAPPESRDGSGQDAARGGILDGGTAPADRRARFLHGMRGAGLRLVGRREDVPAAAPGIPGIGRVMLDAFNITQDRISRARLASDPPDATVLPKVAGIGLFDFHRAEECMELGRQAVQVALPDIRRMLEGAAARA